MPSMALHKLVMRKICHHESFLRLVKRESSWIKVSQTYALHFFCILKVYATSCSPFPFKLAIIHIFGQLFFSAKLVSWFCYSLSQSNQTTKHLLKIIHKWMVHKSRVIKHTAHRWVFVSPSKCIYKLTIIT